MSEPLRQRELALHRYLSWVRFKTHLPGQIQLDQPFIAPPCGTGPLSPYIERFEPRAAIRTKRSVGGSPVLLIAKLA